MTIFLIINFIYIKNLSAFYEVSIENKNNDLSKDYFTNKIIKNLTNSNINPDELNSYITNFFYDSSTHKYHFQIDLLSLQEKLISDEAIFNLSLLHCSLKNDFFELQTEHKKRNCPEFILGGSNKDYIYIKKQKSMFRIKKISNNNFNLNNIWLNFLTINKISKRNFKIHNTDYIALTNILQYYPKINTYEDGYSIIEIEHYFTNEQINFLLEFI